MNCGPPGSSVHGILQKRILEWVAIFFSRGSSQILYVNQGLLHCRRSLPSEPLLCFLLAGQGLHAAGAFSICSDGGWCGCCSLAAVLRFLLLGSMDPRVTGFSCGTGALEHRLSSQEDYFKKRHWPIFLIGSFIFLELSCRSCLYIFEISCLSVASFAIIFSHSEGCLFTLIIVSFVVQKFLFN